MTPPEHKCYAALSARIQAADFKAPGAIEALVEAMLTESDLSVREAALGLIADAPLLEPSQLQFLASHPAFSASHLQKRIARHALMLALERGPLTEALFESCMASSDAVVQRSLLAASPLTALQLGVLRERGANRAIRNLAARRRPPKHGG